MSRQTKTRAVMMVDIVPSYVAHNADSAYWYNDPGCTTGRVRGVWPRLTKARLAEGLSRLPGLLDAALVGRIVQGLPDASDCDVLLQLSLFGKVIYG